MLNKLKNANSTTLRYIILCAIIVVVAVIFSIASPYFLQVSTIMSVIRQTAALAIAAIGMTLVILTGGIDLSAGRVLALSAVCGALVMQAMGTSVVSAIVGIIITVAVAAAVGVVNGFLVGTCGISAFMATLATQYAAKGLTLKLSNADRVTIDSDIYNYFGQGTLAEIGGVTIPA